MRTGLEFAAVLWVLWAYAFWGSQLCRLMDGLVQRLVDREAMKVKRTELSSTLMSAFLADIFSDEPDDQKQPATQHEVAMLIDGQWTIVSIYGRPRVIVIWGSGAEDRYELADELLPTDDGRLLPVYR